MASSDNVIHIRPAELTEARALSALAKRSIGKLGYSDDQLIALMPRLAVKDSAVENAIVSVGEFGGVRLGFYCLVPVGGIWEMTHLYVERPAIGRGFGTMLWEHATLSFGLVGEPYFHIAPEAESERFFLRRGARSVETRPSLAHPGTNLNVLRYRLMF